MKNAILATSLLSLSLMGAECSIMTSPLDASLHRLGYPSWHARTIPIVDTKTMAYTSFVDAYSMFDESVTEHIKATVCEKQKWDGAANYRITWQQTENHYNFIATYDTYANK